MTFGVCFQQQNVGEMKGPPVSDSNKLRTLEQLIAERETWRQQGKTVVWTNGCFDLFHAGHVRALETAKSLGDILIVGLNSDRSVRELKCEGRPLIGETDRAAMLSALCAVDRVLIFDSMRCDKELAALKPDVWTKSGDYTPDSLDPLEREAVLSNGGEIRITPLIPGLSTTLLVKKIRRHDPEKIVSAACTFICNPDQQVLMVAIRYTDGIKWSLPGGGQINGESLAQTALRETKEETGLDVDIVRHMGVIERIAPDAGFHLVMHVFEARPKPGEKQTPHPNREESVEAVQWFDRARFANEPGLVLGRSLWLQYGEAPETWPSYCSLAPDQE